ncbi:MAG TPA: hypothetical protein VM890_11635 [Longimicrobium sp.]|jgi:hypothetical protein|nr:hypothetical protein [Longimicrobium sp.]
MPRPWIPSRSIVLLLLLACMVASAARAQDAPGLRAAAVPARGARAEAFVPAGWKIAAQAQGDLNGDGRADRVLHLVPREYEADLYAPPETGALVILLAGSGGSLRRAGVAPRLLLSSMPQWSLQLAIRRGVLVVGQHYGMADVWDLTHRFRLDAPSRRFILIGRDLLTFHRPQGMYDNWSKSENYLTGVRLDTVGKLQPDGSYRDRVERRRIPRRRTAFEDVNER